MAKLTQTVPIEDVCACGMLKWRWGTATRNGYIKPRHTVETVAPKIIFIRFPREIDSHNRKVLEVIL